MRGTHLSLYCALVGIGLCGLAHIAMLVVWFVWPIVP